MASFELENLENSNRAMVAGEGPSSALSFTVDRSFGGPHVSNVINMGDDADDEIQDDNENKRKAVGNAKSNRVFANNDPSDDDEIDDQVDNETL